MITFLGEFWSDLPRRDKIALAWYVMCIVGFWAFVLWVVIT